METVLKIGGVVGEILFTVVLVGFPTMWLWNILIVDLFELKTIVFSQAVGLNILAGIFFKSSRK